MAKRNRPDEGVQNFEFLDQESVSGAAANEIPESDDLTAAPDDEGLSSIQFPSEAVTAPAVASIEQSFVDRVAQAAVSPESAASEISEAPVPETRPTPEPMQRASNSSQTEVKRETAVSPVSAVPAIRASNKLHSALVGYAISVTLLLLFLLLTGRISLSANHALESLPDIRPLAPNEFRRVKDGTPVPEGHVLRIGESRRFGDVVLTPWKVTREPLQFQDFLSGKPEDPLTTAPVLKLWLKFENVSGDYAFPPFDCGLMSHRTPKDATDDSAITNSLLTIRSPADGTEVKVLNFLQLMDNNFVITGQNSAVVIEPDQVLGSFVACSDTINAVKPTDDAQYTWRIQFRKGVNRDTGHGVTTLVDVNFEGREISVPAAITTPASAG